MIGVVSKKYNGFYYYNVMISVGIGKVQIVDWWQVYKLLI